ncbi:MAG TPA: FlgD immunoglobulin-like domain containing protein [Bacteroidota bacterium]|nr:FlgD immunoglobulin-like domain containing protein [Bacteroidota bacterium]
MKVVSKLCLLLVALLIPLSSFAQHPIADPAISGRTLCQACHSTPGTWYGTYPGYATTAHYGAYDSSAFLNKTSAFCLQCHTTGWDTSKVWQGADEYVNIVLNSQGVKDSVIVSNSAAFLARVNVQCESCHEPPITTTTGFDTSLSATKCGICHGPMNDHSPTYVDWQASMHSVSKYANGTLTLTATNPNCSGCHTAEGFLQWVKQTGLSPTVVVPDTSKTVGITCAGCHDPHSGAITGQLRMAAAQLCEKCHNPEYDPDSAAAAAGAGTVPHHSTAFMFEGKGAYQFGQSVPSSPHTTVITQKCVVCHMATKPFVAGPPVVPAYTGHSFTPQKGACANPACHGTTIDTSAANPNPFDLFHTQSATDSIAGLLAAKLAKASHSDSATTAFKQALFNYNFYENEGSHGIHNTKYAQGILNLAIGNFSPTGVQKVPGAKPLTYSLSQNFPNPFNPSTVINFSIAKRGLVRLDIFDILGKLVTTLANQDMAAGEYRVVWDGADANGAKVSSGIYFYRIEAGSFNSVRKMLLIK